MNLQGTSMGCPICLYVAPSVSLRCASFTMQRTAIQHRQHHVASSWVSTKDFSFRGHWGSLQDVPSKRPHVPIQPGFSALFIAAQQLLPCHLCWCILGGDPRLAWGFTSISASAKLLLLSAGHCSSSTPGVASIDDRFTTVELQKKHRWLFRRCRDMHRWHDLCLHGKKIVSTSQA
jgi:hypothetical protein